MAKKSTKKSARGAAKRGGARKRTGARKSTRRLSNLDRFRNARAIDPDSANALERNATGLTRVESLTADEVKKMISAHNKLSPGRKFEPDPDGSIF
jgi:hypothetical protein